jgi:F0F1-type ATP synthase membrane subunit b/b'
MNGISNNCFLSVSAPLWLFLASDGASWWNYPGFELWKFVNLFVFVAIIVYVLTRKVKLGELFKARRESIKTELQRAQQERDAALAKLQEVEERLARLDGEVNTIQEQSKREAAAERDRIAKSTEAEVTKLGEQAKREIESAGKAARQSLRVYAAETSVRMAEDIIRREMRSEDDVRLISRNVEELGGAAQ